MSYIQPMVKVQEHQSHFYPQYEVIKSKYTKVKWTEKENQRYISFLLNNSQYFGSSYKRRSNKIFKQLSKHMKTKTANQCKSHHQKVILRFGSLHNLIKFYQRKNTIEKIKDKIKQEIKVEHIQPRCFNEVKIEKINVNFETGSQY